MGEIWDAINKDIRGRTEKANHIGYQLMQKDLQEFYQAGEPKVYVRTGAYGQAAWNSGVIESGSGYRFTYILEPPPYKTGSITIGDVMEGIQYNGYGILGSPGTWGHAEMDIEVALERAFS